MAWTLTNDICDIYKEDKAASDALAKLRAIASPETGDGSLSWGKMF